MFVSSRSNRAATESHSAALGLHCIFAVATQSPSNPHTVVMHSSYFHHLSSGCYEGAAQGMLRCTRTVLGGQPSKEIVALLPPPHSRCVRDSRPGTHRTRVHMNEGAVREKRPEHQFDNGAQLHCPPLACLAVALQPTRPWPPWAGYRGTLFEGV